MTSRIGWTNTAGSAVLAIACLLNVSGCQTDAQTWSLLGAGIGAAAGAGLDHDKRGRGAAIGGAVGAGTGYIVGNESDKAKSRRSDEY